MSFYRNNLPLTNNEIFLTDGGLETTLIFKNNLDLPEFAAFPLLENEDGKKLLYDYYKEYISLSIKYNVNFILESPTWRASSKWGKRLGYTKNDLAKINHKAIELLSLIRSEYQTNKNKIVISACIGPKSDGYSNNEKISVEDSFDYHLSQIETFSNTDADLISAFTITNSNEAIGMVQAAKLLNMPIVIGFTVETDAKLPSGESIKEAIEIVDKNSDSYVLYYMINCAHPSHFKDVLDNKPWTYRIGAIRANASCKSHRELDESEVLDDGNPVDFGLEYKKLKDKLKNLHVLGGCCGTDVRHVEEICKNLID